MRGAKIASRSNPLPLAEWFDAERLQNGPRGALF